MSAAPNTMSQAAANAAYANSFLGLEEGTRYAGYSPLEAKSYTDKRSMLAEQFVALHTERKAVTSQTGGAGTAGYALVPVYIDPRMVDTSRKETPFYEIVPKVTQRGLTAEFNVMSAKGSADWYAEGAAAGSNADPTIARSSKPVKYCRVHGEFTGQAAAVIPGYTIQGFSTSQFNGQFADASFSGAQQEGILRAGRIMLEELENTLINGDSGSDADAFDGIIKQIGTTNKLDKNTSDLVLPDINAVIRYAVDDGGRPKLGLCGTAVYEDLTNLLAAKIGFMAPTQQVYWGFSTIMLNTMVGQIPVIYSRFMSNVSGSKSLYFLDMDVIEMRVLQDITYKPLAETTDSTPFMLKWYGCVVVKAPAFNAWIGEIA